MHQPTPKTWHYHATLYVCRCASWHARFRKYQYIYALTSLAPFRLKWASIEARLEHDLIATARGSKPRRRPKVELEVTSTSVQTRTMFADRRRERPDATANLASKFVLFTKKSKSDSIATDDGEK